ncbi:MAG: MFS transporter [Rhodospirillales bacterium]|nr:MFS transporter [Acetobacter sp.]
MVSARKCGRFPNKALSEGNPLDNHATTDTPAIPSGEETAQVTRRRIVAIVAASSGNLVEWYDFYAYSFASIYFAAQFFPEGDATSQLLSTAAVFAVGFFMRPLGGWLFGRVADRYGRRNSLLASVLTMCLGSLLIACLPTYHSVGKLAPALLLLARLIQGLSVGGEYGTAATYMSEVAGQGRRGFLSSFQYVTLSGGQLLASAVITILQHTLTVPDLKAWAWRIPFAVGAVASLVALFLRRTLAETATLENMAQQKAGSLRALLRYKRALFITLAFTMGGSLYFYTTTTYMQKYLVNSVGLDAKTATNLTTGALFLFVLMQPLLGAFSDRIGRKNNMLIFSSSVVLGIVPIMTALPRVGSDLPAVFGLVVMSLTIGCFYTSISGVVKAELFPPEVRALGVGLPYAVANALFGGTAEYIALYLKNSGREVVFFYYVAAMALVTLTAALWMPDTRRYGYLEGSGQIEN